VSGRDGGATGSTESARSAGRLDRPDDPGQHPDLEHGRAERTAQRPPDADAPLHQFTRGNIGHTKQKRPGKAGMLVMVVVILALVVFVPALVALLS
jgi:hypothetical protein